MDLTKANALLDKASESGISLLELVEKEAPVLCSEIIAYGRTISTVWFLLGIIFFIMFFVLFIKYLFQCSKDGNVLYIHDEEARFFAGTALGVINIILLLFCLSRIDGMLKWWIAPRFCVIEQLAKVL